MTEEDIEQAFSNRNAIAYQSAAGPGTLGHDIGIASDWRREDLTTITKRTSQAEAEFYEAIAGSGHLSLHIPVVYSITRVAHESTRVEEPPPSVIGGSDGGDGDSGGAGDNGAEGGGGDGVGGDDARPCRAGAFGSVLRPAAIFRSESHTGGDVYDIQMQDLAARMTRPCAMRLIMGCRTVLDSDMEDGTLSTEQTDFHLYDTMVAILGAASKEPAADGTQLDSMLTPEVRSSTAPTACRHMSMDMEMDMSLCMDMYIHAHTCTCMHMHSHARVYICMYVCMYTRQRR